MASAPIIQARNALANKLGEAYDILKSDAADVDEQIRNRYISIINNSDKLSANPCTNLDSVKRRVSEKLKVLAVLQQVTSRLLPHSGISCPPTTMEKKLLAALRLPFAAPSKCRQ